MPSQLNEDVLAKRIRIFGDDHIETLLTKNNLGWMYLEDDRTEEAVRLGAREKGSDSWNRSPLHSRHHANPSFCVDRTTEAATLNKEVLAKRIRIQGEDHPETLTAMYNLALTLREQGDDVTALSLEVEVLEKRRKVLGNEHPDTLLAQHVPERDRQSVGSTAECTALEYESLKAKSEGK
jgi:hypothetical protein